MKIELHNAYVWDCDNCGAENFERAVKFDAPPEERERMLRDMGALEDYQTLADIERETEDGKIMASLTTSPDRVTCKACGTAYESEDQE
jgi:hypothetical protein